MWSRTLYPRAPSSAGWSAPSARTVAPSNMIRQVYSYSHSPFRKPSYPSSIDVSGKCTLASVRDYYCPSIILIQFSFILLFMQFLCLQNLPFNISKTGAFTKVERVTSCKVAGRYKIQNVCMENSLQLSV